MASAITGDVPSVSNLKRNGLVLKVLEGGIRVLTEGLYWQPREIRFTVEQIKWLLSHLRSLKEGHYPPESKSTGYTDAPINKRQINTHAPFEIPCQIAGELEVRLEACGIDGLLVKAAFCWGEERQSLTKSFNLSDGEVNRKIGRCLRYVSGWRRKRQSYKDFCDHYSRGMLASNYPSKFT